MKKYMAMLLILLLANGLLLTGCLGGTEEPQPEEQPPVQTEQQATATLKGEFQGLADGHSVEITVDGEPQVYQFYDETVAAMLESLETGTLVQFDVETDSESGQNTITKVYEEPSQG